MKRLLFTAVLSLVFTLALSFVYNVNAGDKVIMCHNGGEIEVSSNAVQPHLDIGDTLGPCATDPQVPEFGWVTGALAALGSAGSYLVLKKRSLK